MRRSNDMDAALGFFCFFLVLLFRFTIVNAVPPDACFANFRWDDCGQPPQAVMYYWKPGSRCEVGMWRGCLPNPNMFHDEYECINTCIFVARARPEDYHSHNDPENLYPEDAATTDSTDITDGDMPDVNGTQSTNITGSSAGNTTGDGATGTESSDNTDASASAGGGDTTTTTEAAPA